MGQEFLHRVIVRIQEEDDNARSRPAQDFGFDSEGEE
jgi:hypothetical protein